MKTPITPTAWSGAELPKAINVAPANQFTGNVEIKMHLKIYFRYGYFCRFQIKLFIFGRLAIPKGRLKLEIGGI